MNERKETMLITLGSYLLGILFLAIVPIIGGLMLLLTGLYAGQRSENLKWRGL